MTILLQVQGALRQLGEKLVLNGADMTLIEGQRVALVGRNGAGKSTLCRVLVGDEELDRGEVKRHPELRLAYLRQHDPFLEGESVLDFLMRDSGLEDWRCGKIAGQFELKNERLTAPVRQLSGGWQTRVKLAALLLKEPNVLVLDEPTNFLDLRTQILLERFLDQFKGTTLVVSHDREFLERTTSHTLELTRGQLTMYPGTVSEYYEYKDEQRGFVERSNAAVMVKRKQLERFIAKNRAGANTASQAKNKAKQLERLTIEEVESSESRAFIRVPEVEPRKGTALRCEDYAIGYGDRKVASGINIDVDYGSRVAIVGDNGQGKTTFLRSVTGSLPGLGGKMRWGFGCDIGVYAQHVYTSLPQDLTVLEYLEREAAPEVGRQGVLDIAGSFLFKGNDVQKKVKVLSGGERARLCLAGLLLGKHSVLALDEPGNHLDVESLQSLAEALCRYQGTIIFTSHDRSFMSAVATAIVEVRDAQVVNWPGNYETYIYRVTKDVEDGLREESGAGAKSAAAGPDKEQKKAEARRQHALRKELKSVERQVEKLSAKKAELVARLHEVASDHVELLVTQKDLAKATKDLQQAEDRWLEISESLTEE